MACASWHCKPFSGQLYSTSYYIQLVLGLDSLRLETASELTLIRSTGRHTLQVDGMPADVSCAIVTMLGCIVRNGLVTGFKRAF